MESISYRIKYRYPQVFSYAAFAACAVTAFRFRRRLRSARICSDVKGEVKGKVAFVRYLSAGDENVLYNFLNIQPASRLYHFRPHNIDLYSLQKVLRSRCVMTYGLFIDDRLAAYALLKVMPTGAAFTGLLIDSNWEGRGLGKFLVHFLLWQSSVGKLKAYATISRENQASLRAHSSVAELKVKDDFSNNYILVELVPNNVECPFLCF